MSEEHPKNIGMVHDEDYYDAQRRKLYDDENVSKLASKDSEKLYFSKTRPENGLGGGSVEGDSNYSSKSLSESVIYKDETMEDGTIPGITEWNTADGIHILRLHYTADPVKRSERWVDNEKKGMTEAQWEREYEINFNTSIGKPYFSEFDIGRHVAPAQLQIFPSRHIIRGWDFGLSPATLYAQWGPTGQLCVINETQSWDCGIRAHGHIVDADSVALYPGMKFVDYGDPAGNQRAQTDEKTCYQLLAQEFKIFMIPGPVSAMARSEAIRKLLTSNTPSGSPLLYISPECSWLIAALDGGYHRRRLADGRWSEDPVKDDYSHIVDCLGYIATTIKRFLCDEVPIQYPKSDVK